MEARAGKRQKNLQEAENTQIENIDSDSNSDGNEVIKLTSSDEEYAKNLELEINGTFWFSLFFEIDWKDMSTNGSKFFFFSDLYGN